jgi:hypothetical protein
MAAPLTGSMPQFTNLGYGPTITIEALDPTHGAAVTGVVFTAVEIWADVEDNPGSGGLNVANPILLGLGT